MIIQQNLTCKPKQNPEAWVQTQGTVGQKHTGSRNIYYRKSKQNHTVKVKITPKSIFTKTLDCLIRYQVIYCSPPPSTGGRFIVDLSSYSLLKKVRLTVRTCSIYCHIKMVAIDSLQTSSSSNLLIMKNLYIFYPFKV